MNVLMRSLAAIVAGASLAVPAAAPAIAADSARLLFGVGQYDIIPNDNKAVGAYLQYRFAQGFWGASEDGEGFLGFKPIIGGMATNDDALFGYVGLAAPYVWGPWEFEFSGGPGAYHQGNSKFLGGTFEFHVGAALSREVGENLRLGVAMFHISNANLHDKNRGTNTLMGTLTWQFGGR
ncbi:MAG: acyloxyacyl hydrolase [Rhodobacteraceae bacterium]|nr:acyloxyacyl hydrolase [Paracoccaceae bacterium]